MTPGPCLLSPRDQEAHRFSLTCHDTLEKLPCYCGCGNVGHKGTSMYCVQPESADGRAVIDRHAAI
ncbi:PCYCGC motif-containing (lipo)protein [Chloroflexota bacterium]